MMLSQSGERIQPPLLQQHRGLRICGVCFVSKVFAIHLTSEVQDVQLTGSNLTRQRFLTLRKLYGTHTRTPPRAREPTQSDPL